MKRVSSSYTSAGLVQLTTTCSRKAAVEEETGGRCGGAVPSRVLCHLRWNFPDGCIQVPCAEPQAAVIGRLGFFRLGGSTPPNAPTPAQLKVE